MPMFLMMPFRTLRKTASIPLSLIVSVLTLALFSGPPVLAVEKYALDEEISEEAQAIVTLANLGNEATLRSMRNLPSDAVDKILAHRAAGKSFADIIEVQKVTGISWAQMRTLIKNYDVDKPKVATTTSREEKLKSMGTLPPTTTDKTEADKPAAPATGQGPFTNVKAGYFGQIPGFDHIHTGDPLVKQEFLQVVNRELCQCGCKNETLAFCIVNDPACPIVKARVRKIYDDIVKKAAAAESE